MDGDIQWGYEKGLKNGDMMGIWWGYDGLLAYGLFLKNLGVVDQKAYLGLSPQVLRAHALKARVKRTNSRYLTLSDLWSRIYEGNGHVWFFTPQHPRTPAQQLHGTVATFANTWVCLNLGYPKSNDYHHCPYSMAFFYSRGTFILFQTPSSCWWRQFPKAWAEPWLKDFWTESMLDNQ